MSQYDPSEMHDFLSMTPEKGLRQILVDNKTFTNDHFSMMLKIVRTGSKDTFCEHYTKNDFPKIKFTPNEIKNKETFWSTLGNVLGQKGICQPAVAPKAA